MRAEQLLAIGAMAVWPYCVLANYNVVPSSVANFYNSVSRKKSCSNKLATGFYATSHGKNTFSYCGDHLKNGYMILSGTNGQMADMDIDCDGEIQRRGHEVDGRCGSDRSRSSETAFRDTVKGYRAGIDDLDPYIHSWVVLGNDGSKHGDLTYDPSENGVEQLGLVAVVCNNKLFYGVWGDTYAGRKSMIGEASLSLATACFGRGMNGNNGHEKTDVLYIAFTGPDAVPGKNASWGASTWTDFHESIKPLGDELIKRIPAASNWTQPALTTLHAREARVNHVEARGLDPLAGVDNLMRGRVER